MGRVEFDENNTVKQVGKIPRLRLEEKDSYARVVCLETPVRAFVHRFEMPQIGADGLPVMETKKRRDETEYQAHKMDWVGSPICLGDEGKLIDKGIDTDNCPACEASRSSDYFKPPEPKYAMGVFQYQTKSLTNPEPAVPLSGQVVCWVLNEKRFRKLIEFKNEWGNLQERDLKLGPLVSKNFQTFEMNITNTAVWLSTPENKRWVALAWQENKFTEEQLLEAIGRKVTSKWMTEDIDKVKARWALVTGGTVPASSTLPAADRSVELDAGLDELMAQSGTVPPPASGGAVTDLSDLLGESGMPAAIASQPAPEANSAPAGGEGQSAPEAAPASPASNLTDDLLANIDSAPAQPAVSEPAKPASSGETVSMDDLESLLGGS